MKEGWEYKKLKEVSSFQNGFAFKSNLFRKEGYPIVRISNIQNEEVQTDDIVYFNKEDYSVNFDNYKIYPNDILIAMSGGTTGKLGINTTNTIFYQNQRVGVIREDKKNLNHRFLFYFLHTKSEESLKIAAGAAQPNLSTAQIKDYIIPLPPLPEQQSIVEYLDSAFAKIDAMKANAEKALNEAQALFQASLREMLEPKEGWEEKTFGDVCWYNRNNGLHKGTRYIGMEHIEQGTGNLLGTISSDDVLSNTFAFKKGDVLYGRLRPYLKKVFVADFDGCCSTEIFPIQSESVVARFLMYWFLTDEITNKVNATCAGCRMPRGNMNDVLKFSISYPSLSEQQSIVATLDSLKSKVDRLQVNYDKISQECDALKQSILRQVFE